MKLSDYMMPELTGRAPRIVLKGREEALIEKHRGLLSYDPRKVRVRCAAGNISIDGQDLTIPFFGIEDMMVAGKIDQITFEETGI